MGEPGARNSGEPTNGAAYFGHEVRALRESLGLSQGQFAEQMHYQQGQVSKVENGVVLASAGFAEALDRVAGTPGVYGRLRKKINERGHPDWFVPYLELERKAWKVEDYSTAFIMGALQTPEYAEAVFRAADPTYTDEQVKAMVAARMRRRENFEQEKSPQLWVVINESVLRTSVGGPAVMARQLEHLLEEMEKPGVVVQVLPFSAGAPCTDGPFTLLTQEDGATVLYVDSAGTGRVIDAHTVVRKWATKYQWLRASVASVEQSRHLIHLIREEHANEQHLRVV